MFRIECRRRAVVVLVMFCVLTASLAGCARHRPPRNARELVVSMTATGYCECGKCCGWKRNWYGRPVHAYGPYEGKPKKVGVTAMGTKAKKGTIAADTSRYPFGTVMYVPGYGWGRVEDRGSAIKGNRIDLFFGSHKKALEWGRQKVRVKVWIPR